MRSDGACETKSNYKKQNFIKQRGLTVMVAIAKRLVPAQKISLLQREHFKATHDSVTGLLNQIALDELIEQKIMLSARYNKSFALLMIELDPFQEMTSINSKSTANTVLLDFARRIKACVRSTDTVARIESNVFCILLPDVHDFRNVVKVVDSINFQLLSPFLVNGVQYSIHSAIGIEVFPNGDRTRKSLIEHSYIAMCQSRNIDDRNYCFYDDEIDKKINQQLEIENDIRSAFDQQEYDIHYLPVNNVKGSGLALLQADIVWHSEQLRNINPQAINEHIESLNLSNLFGDIQLTTVFQKLERWENDVEYNNKPVLVALTEHQFNDRTLPDRYGKIISSTSGAAEKVGLLVKESFILQDVEFAVSQIHRLKSQGFMVVIDEFCCGLSYIGKFTHNAVDLIRLDGQMITNMDDQIEWLCVVEGIIRIAGQLGIKTVIKSIDSEFQYQTLLNVNADYWQGNYALMFDDYPATEMCV
jgi:diguanylate cyclase (GGDEF)-like protein